MKVRSLLPQSLPSPQQGDLSGACIAIYIGCCNFDLARRNADCGGTSAVGRVPIPCITIHKSHRDDRPNWMETFGGFRAGRQFLGSAHHSAACACSILVRRQVPGPCMRPCDSTRRCYARSAMDWSPRLWTSCWCQRDISLPGVVCAACTWLHAVGGPGRQRDRQGRLGRR